MKIIALIVLSAAAVVACGLSPRGGAAPQARASYALRGGRILDVETGQSSPASVILIGGGRIVDVLPLARYRADLADSTVDITDLVVVPGLIDAHVHLAIGGPVRANALADLRAGFTTVIDQGALTHRLLRIRDSINTGAILGPRVLAAGIWVGIKGGVCEFTGIGIAGGPEEFRERIRANVAAGADLIKLCVSGWPAEAFSDPARYELSDEILTASVAESHRLGRKVVAHAISSGAVRAALRAGVDGLAHAAYLDSATARDLRARNVFLIPTLASLTRGDSSAASRGLAASVALAYRFGVALVFGTDGGVLPHGSNANELTAMIRAGISPLDAIRSATINPARAFALSDSIGAIRKGMIADIIAVSGDPLRDVGVFANPGFVMSRGRIVSVLAR